MLDPVCNCFAQFFLRRLAKAWQLGDTAGLAGFQQVSNRTDMKLIVERLNLFRAKPLNRKQLENGSRKFRAQVLKIFERAGRRELLDFSCDGFPDSGNLGKLLFILQIRETSAPGFKRPRRTGISANLERVCALVIQLTLSEDSVLVDTRFLEAVRSGKAPRAITLSFSSPSAGRRTCRSHSTAPLVEFVACDD